jgi:hypothetical protein
MAWADTTYTESITGVAVTDALVTQAQAVIELFSGVTESYNLKARDTRHLRMAVAYQAAWAKSQIDVTSRTDVSQVTQDEMSFTAAHEDAQILAPLAQRALKRLSWKTSRSVRLRRPVDPSERRDFTQEFVTDTGDSELEYRPWSSP